MYSLIRILDNSIYTALSSLWHDSLYVDRKLFPLFLAGLVDFPESSSSLFTAFRPICLNPKIIFGAACRAVFCLSFSSSSTAEDRGGCALNKSECKHSWQRLAPTSASHEHLTKWPSILRLKSFSLLSLTKKDVREIYSVVAHLQER